MKDRIIMETTAVYWESKIKTYGFQIERDLSLLTIKIDVQNLYNWGGLVEELGALGIKFNLVFGEVNEYDRLKLFFVVKADSGDRLRDFLSRDPVMHSGEQIHMENPVETVSFQGPHYGDRYGIAFTLFNILESSGISVIASCCSVSCVYLLLNGGQGDEARSILLENFEIPSKKESRKGLLKR